MQPDSPKKYALFESEISWINKGQYWNGDYWRNSVGPVYFAPGYRQYFLRYIKKELPSAQGYFRVAKTYSGQAEIRKYNSIRLFAKEISDQISCDVQWNYFRPSESGSAISFFNIDMPPRGLWRKLLVDIFKSENLQRSFFVFYTLYTDAEEEELRLEKRDILRAESRFLRDYLCQRRHAITIKGVQSAIEEGKYWELCQCITDNVHVRPRHEVREIDKILGAVLRNIFGKNIHIPKCPEELSALYSNLRIEPSASDGDLIEKIQIEAVSADIYDRVALEDSPHGVLKAEADRVATWRDGETKAEIDSEIREDVGCIRMWYHYINSVTKVAELLLKGPLPPNLSILFIDDCPEKILDNVTTLAKLFPRWDAFVLKSNEWIKLANLDVDDLRKTIICNKSDKVIEKKSRLLRAVDLGSKKSKINMPLGKIDIVVIDIEYEHMPLGFDLLRRFRDAFVSGDGPYVFALSRREDPLTIQEALNSGALGYVSKNAFFYLLNKLQDVGPILEIEKSRARETLIRKVAYAGYQNWHLLSKLPLEKILGLQAHTIYGNEYNPEKKGRWIDNCKGQADYSWIEKLPKADLHCHIGSYLSTEILVRTAIFVLAEKMAQKGGMLKGALSYIIEFLIPIAADPWLSEKGAEELEEQPETTNYKQSFGRVEIRGKSIFTIVTEAFSLKERFVLPERALLDPQYMLIEETCRHLAEFSSSLYFRRRILLRQMAVTYDEIMLVLIVMLYLRDNVERDERRNAIGKIGISALAIIERALRITGFTEYCRRTKSAISEFQRVWAHRGEGALRAFQGLPTGQNILAFLRSAHSPERCLENGSASLLNYLRGCEYGGSQNLQTRAAIYLAIESIVQYALNDNIRYLCLRCAVNGYTKFGILSAKGAIESLLQSIDYYSGMTCREGKKIHINVILAANRQKDPIDFEKNAEIALNYRNGIPSENDRKGRRATTFFPGKARVVSFDLCGLEKGNRPAKFEKQFRKLQTESFPITIHAGEEDTADSIREAVYLAFTQRIGHGLSLRQDPLLQRLVRERHIAIELCPLSNLLTGGTYKSPTEVMAQYEKEIIMLRKEMKGKEASFKEKGISDYLESRPEYYPLRQYLNENLDVTINTDNPFISSSTLTKEFLVAAYLVGGLTKWEILRLIKNSFRAAAIPKDEKRKLMNEIDEEIYELMLEQT